MENRLEGGRAGLALVTAGLLILAMFALYARSPAFAQSENCPDGFEHKSDPPTDISKEWGTATLVDPGSVGKFTAVEFFVKDGYTVDVCVKGGNEGFTEDTIVGEDTKVVSTPTNQEVSHYEWTFKFTPPETFDLEVEKAWDGDEFDDTNLEVTLLIDGEEGPVEVEDGDEVTITEEVTGLPENCTYTSDAPFDYTVDADDAVDGLITLTVTNTVSCESTTTSSTTTTTEATITEETTTTIEDEVLGTVVTSTTEATTTTVEDEVLGTHVLPFTGIESDQMAMLAMALLGGGILTLVGSQGIRHRREE